MRDALLTGFSASLAGKVERDVSAAGFDVDIEAPVGGDLNAAGASVSVTEPVGEDVTAVGFNLRIRKGAAIGGNARLSAGNIVLDAPVSGSLIAAAGSMTVNGTVAGEARLTAGELTFGSEARIDGTLTYFAPQPIEVSPSVVAADRVHFQRLEAFHPMRPLQYRIEDFVPKLWPSFLALFLGFLLTLVFLVAVAAIFLSFAPRLVEELREEASVAPLRSLVLGALALAMLLGLVPVSAISLVGIPLIPVVLLALPVFWMAGYLIGGYALAIGVGSAFRPIPSTVATRLVALAVALIVIAALNFIPVFGWLTNFGIGLVGLGAIASFGMRLIAARFRLAEAPTDVSSSSQANETRP